MGTAGAWSVIFPSSKDKIWPRINAHNSLFDLYGIGAGDKLGMDSL
jgi:hypothetical protein